MLVLLFACATDADTASPDPLPEGMPTHWWTWSYECSYENQTHEMPALPTDAPLLVSWIARRASTTGDGEQVVFASGTVDLLGRHETSLCDDGDLGGRITVAW